MAGDDGLDLTDIDRHETFRAPKHPDGWTPTVVGTAAGGAATVRTGDRDASHDELLADCGLDPARYAVVGDVQFRRWEQAPGVWCRYHRFTYTARDGHDEPDYARLLGEIRGHRKPKADPAGGSHTFVLCLSDWQLGKRDGDGTEGIVSRALSTFDAAEDRIRWLRRSGVDVGRIVVATLGDLVEGCDGHYCVTEETPVLTADLRWIPARELQPGDKLYGLDEESQGPRGRRFAEATVLQHEIRTLPTVDVTLSNGDVLSSTPEHPWLCRVNHGQQRGRYEWVEAQHIRPGFHSIAKPFDVWDREETHDAGWIGGMFDGEGHLSGPSDRSARNVLGVSQRSGDVLDRIERLLADRGFDFAASQNKNSNVWSLRIRGGIQEVYRALGTFRPERLIAKVGYPYMRLTPDRVIDVVSVLAGPDRRVAVMGTSTRTFIAGGYAAHNSMQTATVELDRRRQCTVARRLLVKGVTRLSKLTGDMLVVAVPGNHGENRKAGKAFTSFGDNDDVAVVEQTRDVLAANPEAYQHVRFVIPDDDLTVTVQLDGTVVTFAHGHQAKGSGNAQAKLLGWWRDHAFARSDAGYADLLVSAHYHHLCVVEEGERTWMQCPTIDGGSQWWEEQGGGRSRQGQLSFVLGPAGWSHLEVLR